jgi:hypothetical protein
MIIGQQFRKPLSYLQYVTAALFSTRSTRSYGSNEPTLHFTFNEYVKAYQELNRVGFTSPLEVNADFKFENTVSPEVNQHALKAWILALIRKQRSPRTG